MSVDQGPSQCNVFEVHVASEREHFVGLAVHFHPPVGFSISQPDILAHPVPEVLDGDIIKDCQIESILVVLINGFVLELA